MSKEARNEIVSVRVRIPRDVLERIDLAAGPNGRQRFILESLLWRLDKEIPPVVLDLLDDVDELKLRVKHLEEARGTSIYRQDLTEEVRKEVCRDDLDRQILAYFLQHKGATTPELAEELLDDESKRRTIHDRISKLNENAEEILGTEILEFERGERAGKRGAWWISNISALVD